MPDSSDIENAVIAKLQADEALAALTPNGWYIDQAPAGSTQYGIVSLVEEHDEPMYNARAFEDALYLVKHVELSTVAVKNGKAAAARIDAILDYGALTVAGYGVSVMRRDSRVRYTDPDADDSSILWFNRGGRYQIVVSA